MYGGLKDHVTNVEMDRYVADYLFGDGGDDILYVYGKNSVASGGSGNDVLRAQQG